MHAYDFACPNCLTFGLTIEALEMVRTQLQDNAKLAATVSECIRNAPRAQGQTPLFDVAAIAHIIKTGELP